MAKDILLFEGYDLSDSEEQYLQDYTLKVEDKELGILFDFETNMKNIPIQDYILRLKNISRQLRTDDMTEWHDINKCITQLELIDILNTSEKIRKNSDLFIVVGIGGSYLGAQMVIESLKDYYQDTKPEIIFTGTSLSADSMYAILKKIEETERVSVNVISKSGSSLETKIAFNQIYPLMSQKYSQEELKERIFITTDSHTSDLLDFANQYGYKKFRVPNQIGGRYSVLTPVGLLPVAVAGFDIEKLLVGASKCSENTALAYAAVRDDLYEDGKLMELFCFFEPKLWPFGQWLRQLFAETQGKDGKGLWPDVAIFSTDLHSIGQFIQDGKEINDKRTMFETFITVDAKHSVPAMDGVSFGQLNRIAAEKTPLAHLDGGIYSNAIKVGVLDEEKLGYLIHFFEIAAAAGGYLLGINPFDQPGVADYKRLINEGVKELRTPDEEQQLVLKR